MSEEMLIRHCAPTLAGIKTGSLFSCPCGEKEESTAEIRALNQALVPRGLCVIPLRYAKARVLVYVFRPEGLKRDLSNRDAAKLLHDAGYRGKRPAQCVIELIRRLNAQEGFPHEIGLFLSYPPEDVRGFIENSAQNFKCVGCWKVYGDERSARERFSRFEKCTEHYCRQWACGVSLERLAQKELYY